MAQQHLRNVLAALDMPTMGQPEAFLQLASADFNDQDEVATSRKREFISAWLCGFARWTELHQRLHSSGS